MSKALKSNAKTKSANDLFGAPESKGRAPAKAASRSSSAEDAYTAADAVGRKVPAPPWSAACMTDHGPSACGEPMWVYGSPARAHDK